MDKKQYTINPIGFVRVDQEGFYLEINKETIPALQELDSFSHINVLFWCHLVDDKDARKLLSCDKPYKKSPEKMGIFATRSPARPNPIGLTPVAILAIDHERGIVRIPFIDAEEGTPLLDIKPYHPSIDRIKDLSVPKWCSHWPQWYEDSADFDWAGEFVNAR